MELLDRYLQAVKRHLPLRRQDDVLAELRANLESQLEDKESELGRPLTALEAEEWINHFGSPVQMAAQYLPQQSLIGPTLFPIYWYVLRMALVWGTVIYAIVSAISIVAANSAADLIIEAALRVPAVFFTVAAWVTLIFAVLEFIVTRYPQACPALSGHLTQWTSASLPPLESPSAPGTRPRSLARAIAEPSFSALWLGWLLLVPHYPFLLLGPGVYYLHNSPFQFAPVWITFYWWIVALNLIQMAWCLIDLARDAWRQPNRIQSLVVRAVGLIPLGTLIAVPAQAYFTLRHLELDASHNAQTLHALNNGIHTGLLIVCAIIVLHLLWDSAQLVLGAYRQREAARTL